MRSATGSYSSPGDCFEVTNAGALVVAIVVMVLVARSMTFTPSPIMTNLRRLLSMAADR